MRLWTIQSELAYQRLLEIGVLRTDKQYHSCCQEQLFASDWMAEKMKGRGLYPPMGVKRPVWAWYQWEGKRRRRDMGERGYASRGDKLVQLTIEVEDKHVLLSDFDLFHYVMNHWYLAEHEEDDKAFEEAYSSWGYHWNDLQDVTIQTQIMKHIRTKIEKSWDRIFDLDREDDYIYGENSKKSIQAVIWEVRMEQVVQAEAFTAK